jgi:hypothetical protein
MADNFAWQSMGGDTSEEKLFVKFHMGAVLDGAETAKLGFPKFKDVPCVTIAVPGDKSLVVDRPVWDDENNPRSDTQRFAKAWAAFKAGHADDAVIGHPLTEWPPISKGQLETLTFQKIRTVEQLASMSDATCQRFLGSLALREKAKVWLTEREKERPFQELRAEMEGKAQEVAQLRDELASLKAAMQPASEVKPDKRKAG